MRLTTQSNWLKAAPSLPMVTLTGGDGIDPTDPVFKTLGYVAPSVSLKLPCHVPEQTEISEIFFMTATEG